MLFNSEDTVMTFIQLSCLSVFMFVLLISDLCKHPQVHPHICQSLESRKDFSADLST